MMPDHYQALGVQPHAGHAEIRSAYLRLMRAHHPDHRPGDPRSAERARQANEAWDVLGSGAKRAAYDRLQAARAADLATRRAAVVRRVPDATLTTVAYSDERIIYRREFSTACLKLGILVCVVGLLMLATFTA